LDWNTVFDNSRVVAENLLLQTRKQALTEKLPILKRKNSQNLRNLREILLILKYPGVLISIITSTTASRVKQNPWFNR